MSRPIPSPTTLAEFHQQTLDEARANGLRLRAERKQILRAKLLFAGSTLMLLVGSMALGDVTVAQALTTISAPLV